MGFKVGDLVYVKPPEGTGSTGYNAKIVEIGINSYTVESQYGTNRCDPKLIRPITESPLYTKLPEEGTLKKGLQTKGVNIQGEPITISWNFNPVFKEILLDIWYEKSKETWTTAYKECKEVGNDMIVWLSNSYPSEFEKIYQQALDEVGQEMIAQRTD